MSLPQTPIKGRGSHQVCPEEGGLLCLQPMDCSILITSPHMNPSLSSQTWSRDTPRHVCVHVRTLHARIPCNDGLFHPHPVSCLIPCFVSMPGPPWPYFRLSPMPHPAWQRGSVMPMVSPVTLLAWQRKALQKAAQKKIKASVNAVHCHLSNLFNASSMLSPCSSHVPCSLDIGVSPVSLSI